uniref:DUF6783 domain-containing protein n=1 Tax=Enterocloster aldenensis TaxID=358742 RepID=UPI00336ADC4F
MGAKYAAKWGVQMAGINFQTRPSPDIAFLFSPQINDSRGLSPLFNLYFSSVIPGIPQSAKGARAGLILRWACAAGGFIRAAGHRTLSSGG